MMQKIIQKKQQDFIKFVYFWVIILIQIAAYNLFYKIDVISIHNVILPIILLVSLLCIYSLVKGNLLFINRNKEFNDAINYIESLLKENNKENSIENYIYYLNIFKIPYKLNNDKQYIYSEISKNENKLNTINKYSFIIEVLLFLGLFIYSYCSGLL